MLEIYLFMASGMAGSGALVIASLSLFLSLRTVFSAPIWFSGSVSPHDVPGYSKSQDCLPTKKAPFPKQLQKSQNR